jgi:DNA-binding MarR family transcriptional regulator
MLRAQLAGDPDQPIAAARRADRTALWPARRFAGSRDLSGPSGGAGSSEPGAANRLPEVSRQTAPQADGGQATPRDLVRPWRRSAEARRSAVCPRGGGLAPRTAPDFEHRRRSRSPGSRGTATRTRRSAHNSSSAHARRRPRLVASAQAMPVVRDSVPVMSLSGDSTPAEGEAVLDGLVKTLDSAGIATNKAFVRWLSDVELPSVPACALFTLGTGDAPMGMRDVAAAIGISIDDAALALHELRSLGYAREEKRRYEPTDGGRRLLASLADARREALGAFLSGLSEDARLELAAVLRRQGQA